MGRGNYDAAIEDLNIAIELNPDYADAYDNRARSFLATGQLVRATTDLAKARQLRNVQ